MIDVSIDERKQVVINNLKALIVPGLVNGRPSIEALLTVRLNIPLEPSARAKEFVLEYRQLMSGERIHKSRLT